jgi:hypothetical protein
MLTGGQCIPTSTQLMKIFVDARVINCNKRLVLMGDSFNVDKYPVLTATLRKKEMMGNGLKCIIHPKALQAGQVDHLI